MENINIMEMDYIWIIMKVTELNNFVFYLNL